MTRDDARVLTPEEYNRHLGVDVLDEGDTQAAKMLARHDEALRSQLAEAQGLVKAQRLAFYDIITANDERFEEMGEQLRQMSNAKIDAVRERDAAIREKEALGVRLERAEKVLRSIAVGACECCPDGYDEARAYFADATTNPGEIGTKLVGEPALERGGEE